MVTQNSKNAKAESTTVCRQISSDDRSFIFNLTQFLAVVAVVVVGTTLRSDSDF